MTRKRARRQEQTTAAAGAVVNVKTLKSRRILTEEQEEVELEAEVFETDPAYVRISQGVTKNIGEYESLRVEVSISCPCYVEMIDQTAEDCGERVALMLEDELDAYGVSLHGDGGT